MVKPNSIRIKQFFHSLKGGLMLLFSEHRRQLLISLLFSALVIVGFQNCSGSQESSLFGQEDPQKTDLKIENAPFAFDADVNQITYMSCSADKNFTNGNGSLNNHDTFFTFKVGAYNFGKNNNAGVKIKKEFFDYADREFINHRTGTRDPLKTRIALEESPANVSVFPILSIRTPANYITNVFDPENSPKIGLSFTQMFPAFGESPVSDLLLKGDSADRVNYVDHSEYGGIEFGGALHFNHHHDLTNKKLRELLAGPENPKHFLTMTYSENTENIETSYIAKDSGRNKPFGRSFQIDFTNDADRGRPSTGRVILGRVSEFDLATGKMLPSRWNCPQNLRYRIYAQTVNTSDAISIAPGDGNPIQGYSREYCPEEPPISEEGRQAEAILRNHLPASKWIINTRKGCVVPRNKEDECYPTRFAQGGKVNPLTLDVTGAMLSPEDGTQSCYPYTGDYADPTNIDWANNPMAEDPAARKQQPFQCLNYVSVCIRE